MQIKSPLIITPSLMPGFSLGGAFVSIDYSKQEGAEGRTRFSWQIVLPDGSEYSENDLQSGCQGGTLNSGLESLCCFLSAAGESLAHCERMQREPDDDDNASMFPRPVVEWARQYSDELSMWEMELQESVLIEE